MESIFTPVQERRNRKAIAAAITEHGDSLTMDMIPVIADTLASKYVWEPRRAEMHRLVSNALDARLGEILVAMDDAMDTEPVPHVMASRAPVADDVEEDKGPYPRYSVSVRGTNNHGNMFSANLMQRDTTTSKGAATTAARKYLAGELKHISWADDAVITLSIALPRGRWVRCEYDTHYEQWVTVYDSDTYEPVMAKEAPAPADTNEADELRQRIEELEQQVKELEEQKKESERWYQAFEYMTEVEEHAGRGSTVAVEIDRAAWSLSNGGWSDPYTQKDIEQALQNALALSKDASSLLDDYLQA